MADAKGKKIKLIRMLAVCLALVLVLGHAGLADAAKKENPKVLIKTSEGDITVELYPKQAPVTVKNFLKYADDKFYDGKIFHRVIDGFMIQGGGFTPDMKKERTRPPIVNEADNGLKNKRGTLAMARTGVINSATAQFFINLKNNGFLDHKDKSSRGYGYAVFGKVIDGMKVVDKIAKTKTGIAGHYRDVPVKPVVIESVTRIPTVK